MRMNNNRAACLHGDLDNQVLPQREDNRYEITTSTAVIAARGAQFRVSANHDRPWFSWSETGTYASYHLQIARDAAFTQDIQNIAGIVSNHYGATNDLPMGRYFWRIATVEYGGLIGPYSEPRGFTIP